MRGPAAAGLAFGTLLLLSGAHAGIATAAANAYIPASDSVVLERVPAAAETRRLEPLREKLKANPQDLPSALALAQGYLTIGRETGDPRFLSYANSTLTSWLLQPEPPAAALVLSATALQGAHRFDDALALLDRALQIDSRNAQASLTKATLLQVKGNFESARAACKPLFSLDPLISVTCIASVDSLNGRLAQSYSVMSRAVVANESAEAGVRGWMLGQLAEMAVRLGDTAAAERHFKEALRASPEDAYLKGAYADLLLLSKREREVARLLRGQESNDVLLLRLAIAGRRVSDPRADEWANTFDARRRAARPDDTAHLREYARFLLEVREQPAQALKIAERNWQVQREPADIRLYVRSAERAGQSQSSAVIQEWIRRHGYEDKTL